MLFIGGPADGQRINIPDDRGQWDVVRRSPLPIADSSELPSPETMCKITRYLKMPFRGNAQKFFVMAEEKLTPDDVIAKLIRGYNSATYFKK